MGLTVAQPVSLRSADVADRMRELRPDVVVVVAYGKIVPDAVLAIPCLGPVNIHASILPRYRGPAPIQWAIINGETETGITTIMMDSGIDTGDILETASIPLTPDDTAQSLHDRLSVLGADVIITTLSGLAAGSITPRAQDHELATYAPMLKKSDGQIDWSQPAETIEARIRGLSPWPGAFTFLEGKRLKILAAEAAAMGETSPPGTVLRRFPDQLVVASGHGAVSVQHIQAPSGKRLAIDEFLRGCRIPTGTRLG
jgi:methionyl-tRNA formyltransferase